MKASGHIIFAAFLALAGALLAADPPDAMSEAKVVEETLKKAKDIIIACRLYALDHADRFPEVLVQLPPDYLRSTEDLVCPLDPKERIGYEYFGGKSDLPVALLRRHSAFPSQQKAR